MRVSVLVVRLITVTFFKKKIISIFSQNMDEIKNQVQTLKSVNFIFLNTDDLAPKNVSYFQPVCIYRN